MTTEIIAGLVISIILILIALFITKRNDIYLLVEYKISTELSSMSGTSLLVLKHTYNIDSEVRTLIEGDTDEHITSLHIISIHRFKDRNDFNNFSI